MAQGHIYTFDLSGDLRRMSPAAPENEDRMQELVAKIPRTVPSGLGRSEAYDCRFEAGQGFIMRGVFLP
jgi:hypothetical protein